MAPIEYHTNYSKDIDHCYTLAKKHHFSISTNEFHDPDSRYNKPTIRKGYLNTYLWMLEELGIENCGGSIPHCDRNSNDPLQQSNGEYLVKHFGEFVGHTGHKGAYISDPTTLRRKCRQGDTKAIDFCETVAGLRDYICLDEEGMSRLESEIIDKYLDEEWEDTKVDIEDINEDLIPYERWEAEFREALRDKVVIENGSGFASKKERDSAREVVHNKAIEWADSVKECLGTIISTGRDWIPFGHLEYDYTELADKLCPEGGSILDAMKIEETFRGIK